MDVAEELIAKQGFNGTSVRDISTKANINVAMISYYFGSKEKMMSYLYQYRIQRTRENFSEFSETIKEGRPEMQMKEIIKFIVKQLFRYNYFHGFVNQESRNTEHLNHDLLEFYLICVKKIEVVIKKGLTSGVFTNAPKAEDILSIILGTTLFVIRNEDFYELYIPNHDLNYINEAEKKVNQNLLTTIFAVLGFILEH